MNMNNKKMKKGILAICMGLMIALVCGMGAMTYSKYITTQNPGTQQATAAKWGFVITANTDDLFGTGYTKDTGDTYATITDSGVAVKASSTANVVAPGTSGSMTISVNGSAEVRAKLTISMTAPSDIHLGTDYYPIVWKLGDNTYDKLADLAEDLNETTEIDAGKTVTKDITISWAWAFEGQNNESDTKIGLIANKTETEGENDSITLGFDLTITVEQIQ